MVLIRDIMSMYNDPPPGMFVVPDKDNMTKVMILLLLVTVYPIYNTHNQYITAFLEVNMCLLDIFNSLLINKYPPSLLPPPHNYVFLVDPRHI